MKFEILENLKKAVIETEAEEAAKWAKKSVEEGIDPIAVADALTDAIKQVGDSFGRGELFLPDLVMSAEAMKSAMPIIQEELKRTGKKQKTLSTVVIGTVYGDIHDIGKNVVSTLLTAQGFGIIDLGVNVTSGKFVETVKKHKPDILAISALMTTTAPEQRKIIKLLEEEGIRDRVKIMVGGGGLTEEFSKTIGADGYGATAMDAVELAKRLIGIE